MSTLSETWRSLWPVLGLAVLMATLFTLWTPANLLSNSLFTDLLRRAPDALPAAPVAQSTQHPGAPRIGLVAGHWQNDSGSVCADGLTEAEVNLRIATLAREQLLASGYQVDLLAEFDEKLKGYQAAVLVSIHNDSCAYINNEATGFKVAAAVSSGAPEKAGRLTACLVDRYHARTGLPFHYNSITPDMTSYHAFDEISPDTPAAIIETGFLNLDREMLTRQTDRVAEGVASGILCYVRNENIPSSSTTGSTLTAPLETPAATPAP
jgi:N-acetylmuramoyl-L-alanine amidase